MRKNSIKILPHFILVIILIMSSCKKNERQIAIRTGNISNLTVNTVDITGEILDIGEGISQHGHCFDTKTNPDVTCLKTSLGICNKTGEFVSHLNGLLPSTKYYVKAYSSKGNLIIYGSEISFTTIDASAPTLTTTSVTSITSTTASGGGNITSDGGEPVTKRGVCWSTFHLPSASANFTNDGTGPGEFMSSITGLIPNQTYYVRAYAINNIDTTYGNETSFQTDIKVGDNYQGGIVAYILQHGDPGYSENVHHGLIATNSDLTTTNGVPWDNGTYALLELLGANGSVIGTGKTNTDIIISHLRYYNNYAAGLCENFSTGGYGDWYLPSIDELNKLYINRELIGGFDSGSILTHLYWSSTEFDNFSAYYLFFDTGNSAYGGKPNPCRVRAVRSF